MEAPLLTNIKSLTLERQPHIPIKYFFSQLHKAGDQSAGDILIVFVNGLGLHQAFWQPAIRSLQQDLSSSIVTGNVWAVTFDRIGQGRSQPMEGHTLEPHAATDAVDDLHEFRTKIEADYLAKSPQVRTVFVCHSIGGPLVRLYMARYPGTVDGVLFVASNIPNTDWVSLMPDPDLPDFDEKTLPGGTTVEQLRWTRENFRRMFHQDAPNAEKLVRSKLPELLPESDKPAFTGRSESEDVLLTVVSHDPVAFADESERMSTRALVEKYIQPAWDAYNQALLKLSGQNDPNYVRGVIMADGAGHFVQRDNPRVVSDEILLLVKKIRI